MKSAARLARYTAVMLGLAVIAVLLLDFAWYWKMLAVLAVIGCAALDYHRTRHSWTKLRRDLSGNWSLQQLHSEPVPFELSGRQFMTPALIVIGGRAGGRPVSLWLFRDQLGNERFRRLTVLLKTPVD